MELYKLDGKSAIITGGASGIGQATALLFVQMGASVAIIDIDRDKGEKITSAINETTGNAIFVHCDVSSADQCKNAVAGTTESFGKLDILVNAAGIIKRTSVTETTEEDWNKVMNVNLTSAFFFAKYCIPAMIKNSSGAIVNISSGWGLIGGAKAASYCASKGAVVQLTKSIAIDYGKHNIRANCICPGDTDTEMLKNEAKQLGQGYSEFLKEAADRPLQRTGKPEDIAQAALYLASDASSFVTGTTLVVDGGGLAG